MKYYQNYQNQKKKEQTEPILWLSVFGPSKM